MKKRQGHLRNITLYIVWKHWELNMNGAPKQHMEHMYINHRSSVLPMQKIAYRIDTCMFLGPCLLEQTRHANKVFFFGRGGPWDHIHKNHEDNSYLYCPKLHSRTFKTKDIHQNNQRALFKLSLRQNFPNFVIKCPQVLKNPEKNPAEWGNHVFASSTDDD